MSDLDYKTLIPLALQGDADALEGILLSVRDQIYNLALRFLWHPQEAEDAAQEILVKIMLHLNQFEFRSAFSTWTYRIATNYLIDTKRTLLERSNLSFEDMSREIAGSASMPLDRPSDWNSVTEDAEDSLSSKAREVQTACTHAMLQCLDRNSRMAFILGEVFNMHSDDAGYVLGTSSQAYRQRLSRARSRMTEFMQGHCGLMDDRNHCRCSTRACQLQSNRKLQRYLGYARRMKTAETDSLPDPGSVELGKMALIYRSNRSYVPRFLVLDRIKRTLNTSSREQT